MSIGSTNIYDLLSGEEEEVKTIQAPPKKATTPAQKVATKPKEVKKPAQVGAPAPPTDAPVKETRVRKDKLAPSGNRNLLPKKAKEVQAPGAKRVFDRHSGTGRGKTENKKSGAGKGNWGNIDDQGSLEEKPQEATSEPKEEGNVKVEEDKEQQQQTEGDVPQQQEEEEKTMTLAEFKKSTKKSKVVSAPKVRQSGEGVDPGEWKEFTELKRDESDTLIVGPKKSAATAPATQAPKKEEQSPKEKPKKEGTVAPAESRVRVDEVFNIREGKEFRPRGGRGGGDRRRGGSGSFSARGGKRGGSSKPFNYSEDAFPSLTTKA